MMWTKSFLYQETRVPMNKEPRSTRGTLRRDPSIAEDHLLRLYQIDEITTMTKIPIIMPNFDDKSSQIAELTR